ncbi:MAG: hypothetical protein WC558_09640 [Patulibacter sp.]
MSFTPLLPDEREIVDTDETLWRLVHPRHIDEQGFPSSEAFADVQRMISVVQSRLRTAREAYDFHRRSHECDGAWPIPSGVVHQVECRVVDDTERAEVTTPGHAYVDYRHLKDEKRKRKRLRTELAAAASALGRAHPE